MALPQGGNFRNSLAYVTDGANEDWVGSSADTPYPTTSAQGNNWGWEEAATDRGDYNSSNDRRLAGEVGNNSANANFRIDLPSAGDYDIRLAAGSASYVRTVDVSLFDTTTSLGVLSSGSTSATQRFNDATDTEYTNATWPGSNTAVTKTFATTICRFRCTTANSHIAHVNVAAPPSAALTGTATASITEADIVTGGKTVILTLTGDTWIT